jgi:hypothetical protein
MSARKLGRTISEVSLDSDGYPKLLSEVHIDEPMVAPIRTPFRKNRPGAIGERLRTCASFASRGSLVRESMGIQMEKTDSLEPKSTQKVRQVKPRAGHADPDWGKMFYKAQNGVGIREKFGDKRQVFCLSSRSLTRAELESIADDCICRMRAGKADADTKEWGKEQVAKSEARIWRLTIQGSSSEPIMGSMI